MLMGLSLAMLLGSPLVAQEEKAEDAKKAKAEAKQTDAKKNAETKKADRKGKRASLADQKLKELAKVELTEEQKTQIQELAAEVEPKLEEARKKVNELIPAETRKARQEAVAKAKAEGKKPEDVVTAFKLTEEQLAAQKAVREVQQGFNKKVNELLTPEQRQALRKNRQAGEKKPAPKKAEAKETKVE